MILDKTEDIVLETLENICIVAQEILGQIDYRHAERTKPLDHYALAEKLRSLRTDLQYILQNRKILRPIKPAFFMWQWTFTSIRKSLRKIEVAEKVFATSPNERFLREATLASLWAYQAVSIFNSKSVLKEALCDMDRFIFDHQTIKKGDIVLSYKTPAYLQKDILARLVYIATNSSITHSLIATESGAAAKLLCSSPGGNGINLSLPFPAQGEIYIIMRLKDTDAHYAKLVERSIDTWNERIETLYVCKFPEFKSWVASALGFLYTLSIYTLQRPIILQNFAKNQQGLFCSEIIDNIFKEAGILITPRSEYDALIGPVELFHSPYLALQGIIMNEEDRETIRKDLTRQFNLR